MVGTSTTPTKNTLRPNVSTNPSMAPTRISDSSASSAAATSSTTTAVRIDQAGPAWPSGSPWPPSVCAGLVNW